MTVRPLTSDDARRLGGAFAAGLDARGLPAGSRVAFSASTSPELLAAVLGTLLSGRAPVVLSGALTDAERARLVADADPDLLVRDADLPGLLTRRPVELADVPACRPVHYTSGTTGSPKGVWSGWLPREDAQLLVDEEQELWAFEPADRFLLAAPLSHSAPLRFALHALLAGGSVLVLPRFDAPAVAAALPEVTTTFLAPTSLQRLLRTGPAPVRSLRWLAHAGAHCPASVRTAAAELVGPGALVEFYGSTEGQFTVCPFPEWQARPGTVGRARPGRTLSVVDGQVWCRPPRAARFEYWRAPEKTAATWRGDAFTVGDLGRLDDDGYLFLEGRRSDLVITGGVNVYPAEVEAALAELSGVEAVAVFGVDDDEWGQRVCAAVVGDVTEEALREHAARALAPYKRPKTLLLRTDLPLTHSGKVDRLRLPDLLG